MEVKMRSAYECFTDHETPLGRMFADASDQAWEEWALPQEERRRQRSDARLMAIADWCNYRLL